MSGEVSQAARIRRMDKRKTILKTGKKRFLEIMSASYQS
jgi:hypothetical protein